MKDKELRDRIKRECFGFDDDELSTEIAYRDVINVVDKIADLIAQERRKAKIEVYEELKPSKEFEQFSRLTGGNPCAICGFDPIAFIGHIDNRIAELKEDKEA